MELVWTSPQGVEVRVYASGEKYNCDGDACYIVSKFAGSPYVFLARKSACRPA